MSRHNGLYCTNGIKCQREECTEQHQLCRNDTTYMQKHPDLYDENKRLRAEVASLKEQNALLVAQGQRVYAAADAVVKRWDTPLWKDVRPTAELIYALRDALTALPQQVKSDARDAERYRYLRSHNAEQFDRLVEDSLDDAIDAAISAQEEKS